MVIKNKNFLIYFIILFTLNYIPSGKIQAEKKHAIGIEIGGPFLLHYHFETKRFSNIGIGIFKESFFTKQFSWRLGTGLFYTSLDRSGYRSGNVLFSYYIDRYPDYDYIGGAVIIQLNYSFFNNSKISPVLGAGFGFYHFEFNDDTILFPRLLGYLNLGGEYNVDNDFSMFLNLYFPNIKAYQYLGNNRKFYYFYSIGLGVRYKLTTWCFI